MPASGHTIGLLLPASFALAVSMALAQEPAGVLTSEQLLSLARGNTWAIKIGGGGGDLAEFWDFNADGSVCGRLTGAKPRTKCADVGKWKVQGDTICWDFTWHGQTYGYKSVCARARTADAADKSAYVLIDQNGKLPPLQVQVLRQAKGRK
jgi:hypothetical protein